MVEFKLWEKERKDELIRNAAEKGWNAVVQATNALLIAKGYPEEVVRSHKGRRLALEELELKDPKVAEKGLRDRFGAREHHLHVRCFYEGEYLPEKIKEDLLKVVKYIDDVEKILGLR